MALKVIELLNLREDAEFTRVGVLRRLFERIGLIKRPKPVEVGAIPAVRSNDGIADIISAYVPGSTEPERDSVVVAVAERLKVQRIRTTTLIEIRYSSADPVKAARIANTIAEVYIKDQIDEKARASNNAASLLEEKLTDLKRRVSEAEYRVESFKSENNIFDAEGQILSEKQLARLMEQTVLARNATAEAKAKFEQARRMIARGGNKDDVADVLQSHTIRLMKEELAKLTRREAELLTKYGPKHPEILKVKAEISDAESQLNAEVERLIANLKNAAEIAEDREHQLTGSLGSAKDQQASAKEAAVKLKELQRDAQTSKQLFEALLTRYKQTTETQDLQLADARIVERAGVPLQPMAPKRKQILLMGIGGGLGLGIVLAFLLELMAPGLARPEDVKRALEIDHLASVPQVEGSRERLRAARLMVADPDGVFADSIRGLRHELDGGWPYHAPRIVMLASSLPNEGKSSLASNLAHHLALTGVRTLLVDADLRKATLTQTLCPGGAALGARDCLEQRMPVEDAILRDTSTGLCFLPAEGRSHGQVNASELLVSPMMTGMIGRLREHFDTIIIDCPPLLPVVDARILADFADQIVFVMSWRKTPKELARKALKNLGANQRKVLGVVLNQVDERKLAEASGYEQGSARQAAA